MLADNDPVSDSTPEAQQTRVRAAEYVRMLNRAPAVLHPQPGR
jgi:hypothetical protein